MNREHKERWALVFQAEGPGQPLAVRIKILLKRALRQHGLRCVSMSITSDQGQESGVGPDQAVKIPHGRNGERRYAVGTAYDPSENPTRQNRSYCKGATP